MFRLFSIFLVALFMHFGAWASDQKLNDAQRTAIAIQNSPVAQYRTSEELIYGCSKTQIGTQGQLICAYQISGMHDALMVLLPNLKGFESLDMQCYQESYHSWSPLQESIFLGKWLRENPEYTTSKAGSIFFLFWLNTHPIPSKCWK